MERKLFGITVFYLLGIYLAVIYDIKKVFSLSVVLLCAMAIKITLSPKGRYDLLIIICVFIMLFGSFYVTHENKSDFYGLVRKTVSVTARVSDYHKDGKQYNTVIATAILISKDDISFKTCEKVQMRIYDKNISLSPGDIVRAEAKIILPNTSYDITTDNSLSLKAKKIFAILSVKKENLELISKEKPNMLEKLNIIRKVIGDRVSFYIKGDEGALVRAMLLGDKSKIDKFLIEKFSHSGLSHILAVSGMHISFMTALVFAVFKFLRVSKRRGFLFIIPIILFYVPLTGMSPSAVRAGIMTMLLVISKLIFRRADSLTSLSFSALMLTLVNPFCAFSLSFMLSFGATLGILLFGEKLTDKFMAIFKITKDNKYIYKIIQAFSLTCSSQVFTAPIVALYFGVFSLWSFITNILTIVVLTPLFAGGMVFVLATAIFPPLAKICSYFVFPFAYTTIKIADFFSGQSVGIIKIKPTFEIFFIYILFVLVICLFFGSIKGGKEK